MKCNVIINPSSGKGKAPQVWDEVTSIFNDSGWTTTVHVTETADISRYLTDCQSVIAVGGDGTFHNIVNNLMHAQHKIPLGFIPAGTGNDVMMDLNCSNPRDAAKRIVKGKRRLIDIFEVTTANEKSYSICIVGWGMFSAANQTAEKLRWLGSKRYTIAALYHLLFKQTYPATLKMGNDLIEGQFIAVFASNTIHTGKGMKLAPKAKMDDGLMDLVIIKNENRLTLLKLFNGFMKGQYLDYPQVLYKQTAGFELKTDIQQLLDIDGEIKGTSPFSVRVLPKALELLM